MKVRTALLAVLSIFIAVSCAAPWDRTYDDINFPETFQGTWVDGSTTAIITKSSFTITQPGESTITNESEYRLKFDWVKSTSGDNFVMIIPENANGSIIPVREDRFELSADDKLTIKFGGENERTIGPLTREVQTSD